MQSHQTPVDSPPLTPKLGCSLADKMTSTIPMMNHSFRIRARRPMFQPRASPDHPAGHRLTSRAEVLQLFGFFSGGFSVRKQEAQQTGAFSGHMGHNKTVKTGGDAQQVFQLPCYK